MRKVLFILVIMVVGFTVKNLMAPGLVIPQFTDEENQQICIEEGI